MTRDITPIKWIIGAIALLIIVAGACYLWYQHSLADERKAAAEALKLLRQQEATQKTENNEVEQATDVTPAESIKQTAEKSINENTAEVGNNTESGDTKAKMLTETAEAKDVPVSPHGFGPYPEVPADYTGTAAWHLYTDPEYELLVRVRIKLWKQGIKAEGITTKRNGLFYPIIKGVRYVEWDTREYPDGSTERYVSRSTGHPDDSLGIGDGPVFESDIPGHLTIYTYPDGGIDPYQFLDLPKE